MFGEIIVKRHAVVMMAPVHAYQVRSKSWAGFCFRTNSTLLHVFRVGNASDHPSPSDKHQLQCITTQAKVWHVTVKALGMIASTSKTFLDRKWNRSRRCGDKVRFPQAQVADLQEHEKYYYQD
jgi:hypothetical protein